MKITLLADYRGVLTDEQFYTAGTYETGPGTLSEAQANELVSAGRAVEEIEKARRASPKRKTATKRPKAKAKAKAK